MNSMSRSLRLRYLTLGALLIVQHDPEDTAKLPAFPEAAR